MAEWKEFCHRTTLQSHEPYMQVGPASSQPHSRMHTASMCVCVVTSTAPAASTPCLRRINSCSFLISSMCLSGLNLVPRVHMVSTPPISQILGHAP
jgi:hypothetical protein